MKQHFLLLSFILCLLALPAFGQDGEVQEPVRKKNVVSLRMPPMWPTFFQAICVRVTEVDGSPNIPCITKLVVPNTSLTKSGATGTLTFGNGNVTGAASSTDNAIVRFDGTTGKIIQNSGVTIDDTNGITGITKYTMTGAALGGGGTTDNFFSITGTMPTTMTATTYGVNHQITGAGSSAQTNSAWNLDYLAGYTGAASTIGIRVINASAGTLTTFFGGNFGFVSGANGSTTGTNMAAGGTASGGNLNYGGFFQATAAKASATNIGVAGYALNTQTTPTQIGGYFALTNANPTFTSAALIANNGTQTDPIARFQDNGADSFVILDGGRVYGTALHNNAGAVTGTTNQYIASGTYTPALTNVTNVAASTAYACQWIRVGNVVTVSGKVDIDVTAAAATELGISLPIASALTAEEQLGGVAASQVATTPPGRIRADATNDRAAVVFTATSISNDSYSFTFTYVVL